MGYIIGKAIGLVTLLRGAPVQWKAGHIYLPQDLTLKVRPSFVTQVLSMTLPSSRRV